MLISTTNAYFFFLVIPSNAPRQYVRAYLKSGEIVRDTLFIGSIEINDTVVQYLKIRNTKVFPNATDSIIVNGLIGIPIRTTWLFKIVDGEISLYTNNPYTNMKPKIVAWQTNGSEIKRFSLDSLREYVKDEKKPSRYLKRTNSDGSNIKPRPIKAAIAYNTKNYLTKNIRDSLMYEYRNCIKCELEVKINILTQVNKVDSTYDKAYWELGNIYRDIDGNKACEYYYKFFMHNFKKYKNRKALKRIYSINPTYIFKY